MATATRVLIIDDDRDTAEGLTLLIEPRGYAARTAATGREARAILRAWEPQLVLMDMVLPDVQGLELLREFRESRPETQVIMVTGHRSASTVMEAMGAGAFSIIEKPVDLGILRAMLDKAGEKIALSDENRRLKEELREHTI